MNRSDRNVNSVVDSLPGYQPRAEKPARKESDFPGYGHDSYPGDEEQPPLCSLWISGPGLPKHEL